MGWGSEAQLVYYVYDKLRGPIEIYEYYAAFLALHSNLVWYFVFSLLSNISTHLAALAEKLIAYVSIKSLNVNIKFLDLGVHGSLPDQTIR